LQPYLVTPTVSAAAFGSVIANRPKLVCCRASPIDCVAAAARGNIAFVAGSSTAFGHWLTVAFPACSSSIVALDLVTESFGVERFSGRGPSVGQQPSSRWCSEEPKTHGNRGAARLGSFEWTFSVRLQVDFASGHPLVNFGCIGPN